MDKTIEFIIAMLDMNGFDSFEAWFGHPKLKQVIMFCLLRATQIWEMNCWQMVDEGFTFEETVSAVDHMMLNVGAY